MRNTALSILVLICLITGCRTVHSSRENALPVALWPSMLLVVNKDAPTPEDKSVRLALDVLRAHGLHPTEEKDNRGLMGPGITIPDNEELRAREVLLTDPRMRETNILVFLAIPAGSGHKTRNGFEIPILAPEKPVLISPESTAK